MRTINPKKVFNQKNYIDKKEKANQMCRLESMKMLRESKRMIGESGS